MNVKERIEITEKNIKELNERLNTLERQLTQLLDFLQRKL